MRHVMAGLTRNNREEGTTLRNRTPSLPIERGTLCATGPLSPKEKGPLCAEVSPKDGRLEGRHAWYTPG